MSVPFLQMGPNCLQAKVNFTKQIKRVSYEGGDFPLWTRTEEMEKYIGMPSLIYCSILFPLNQDLASDFFWTQCSRQLLPSDSRWCPKRKPVCHTVMGVVGSIKTNHGLEFHKQTVTVNACLGAQSCLTCGPDCNTQSPLSMEQWQIKLLLGFFINSICRGHPRTKQSELTDWDPSPPKWKLCVGKDCVSQSPREHQCIQQAP